jgi:UDP-sugar transporter A1/2/3
MGASDASLRAVSLVSLVVQNVLLVVMIKYARLHPAADGLPFLGTVLVACENVLKLVVCLACEAWQDGLSPGALAQSLRSELSSADMLKVAVPGLLYTLQTNLLFVGVSNLDVGVYQVLAQVKIGTTAFFSVVMLGKRLSLVQVQSLLLLAAGAAAVELSAVSGGAHGDDDANPVLGAFAVVAASLSSGFASVYFEKLLKHGRPVSLFMRNIQLATWGLFISLGSVAINDYAAVREHGPLQGFGPYVWAIGLLQTLGGLLVALVMKYADNILKGFATSVSIIGGTLLSASLFSQPLSREFLLGTALVLAAVQLYGMYPAAEGRADSQAAYGRVSESDGHTTGGESEDETDVELPRVDTMAGKPGQP